MTPSEKAHLREGISKSRAAKIYPTDVAKSNGAAGGEQIIWGSLVDKPIPNVHTWISPQLLTSDAIEDTRARLSNVLGDQGKTIVHRDRDDTATGEITFTVNQLSEQGAKLLAEGWWVTLLPPGVKNERRGLYLEKRAVIGTAHLPTYKVPHTRLGYKELHCASSE
jgi:hypothetical protein